jgi:hypothetical protein
MLLNGRCGPHDCRDYRHNPDGRDDDDDDNQH